MNARDWIVRRFVRMYVTWYAQSPSSEILPGSFFHRVSTITCMPPIIVPYYIPPLHHANWWPSMFTPVHYCIASSLHLFPLLYRMTLAIPIRVLSRIGILGGGRRGVCRAHNNYTQTHDSGWVQDVEAERCTRKVVRRFLKILLINIHYNWYISAS